jgi:superfamily II RNA helicase
MTTYFDKFPFPLSDFQKYAIDGIVNNNHVLVTAHTGSGKTLPAEFAIDFFCSQKKRVIYTSPIKALSNEKYHDFCKKFPQYTIGILTGDIKFNPDADLLIMTTEILQNHLYKRLQDSKVTNGALNFDMDIDNDLSCVIFDEIHYINDADRGKVWEETILMLPSNISMVMLSATIDRPEKFATWCENRYPDSDKRVILTGTEHRVVPLKHYMYLNSTEYLFKLLKDKDKEKEIKKFIKKPQLLKEGSKIFDDTVIKSNKILSLMKTKGSYVKPTFILNSLITYLYNNEMLPAICFVFSRANVEKYAHQINVNLFGYDDAHVPSILPDECDKIIRKLPNYNEYKELNEYKDLVALMCKGVAIHHSGMMPILREMVEIIFGRGYLKVLFATETFAVGINMPTKTVIFTALSKYTSSGHRQLFSHEYTQMAGRAGRRGLDTIGHVIHCNNLFRDSVSLIEYKQILSGKPQSLQSKFKISYSLLLNLIALNKVNYSDYVKSSMLKDEINNSLATYELELEKIQADINRHNSRLLSLDENKTDQIKEFIEIENGLNSLNNKKRKIAHNKLNQIQETYGKTFKQDLDTYKNVNLLEIEKDKTNLYIVNVNNYIDDNVNIVLDILEDNGFIEKLEESYELTVKGKIASNIHECNCLVIAEIIYEKHLDDYSVNDLVSFMSCFTNVSLQDEFKNQNPSKNKNTMKIYNELADKYLDLECKYQINTGNNDEFHYDIMDECYNWCNADNESECLQITNNLLNKGIFMGEFVKAILKINNVANECITACEYIGNIKLSEQLNKIPDVTLKFIILQQSLYL